VWKAEGSDERKPVLLCLRSATIHFL